MLLKGSIILVIFALNVSGKKGPHHPHGSYVVKRETRNQEFSEHLNHHKDKEHMEEDLSGMHVKHKDVSEMTDEEKSFYFFKVHDTDGNNNLDGLEMIKAALHRHGSVDEPVDLEELNHITNVVDEFLLFADLDKNGFLNYVEYKQAMKASTEDMNEQPQPTLQLNNSDNNEI